MFGNVWQRQCFVFLFYVLYLTLQVQPLRSRRPYWASSDEECTLPSIRKGRARWLRRPTAKFLCQPSYTLVGMRYIACRDGEWEEPLPVCARSGCEVPLVPHSLMIRRYEGSVLEFFCLTEYKMVGGPVVYCDGTQWNATAPVCVPRSPASPEELSCNFDADMCGWQQDDNGDFDWTRTNRKTPSSMYNTGPSKDHTTGSGFYMYIESTGQPENKTARLLSPVYDANTSTDGCFSFFYHMYGSYIGGLRVYQKPMSVLLEDLKEEHLLFEKWYNQGDVWLESVSKLNNTSEYFQIVIEGVRGHSYTSDIAIDDVAILRGENCSGAVKFVTTTPQPLESCVDRCNQPDDPHSSDCSCSWDCLSEGTCCQDIIFVCVDVFDKTTTEQPPQTQKLVYRDKATTDARPTFLSSSTTRAPTPAQIPVTTTTTKKPPSSTSTTTSRTTTSTEKSTTHHAIVFKSTRAVFNATGVLKKENRTTAPGPAPGKPTATSSTSWPRVTKQDLPTTPGRSESKAGKSVMQPRVTETSGSSGGKATAITFAILLCCTGVACAVLAARTARGRATLDRLRGRTTASSEVRYLTADTDD